MKLKYLKYLRCHCGNESLAAYRLADNSVAELKDIDGSEALKDGLLLCTSCGRFYPVSSGILKMLPDGLYDRDRCGFANRYRNILNAVLGGRLLSAPTTGATEVVDKSNDKKNEMHERDRQAENYHRYGYWLYGQNEERHFIRSLNVSANDFVLELGCGTGRITTKVIRTGLSGYIAIDFSERSLELLYEKLDEDVRENILLVQGDVCNLPLKGNIADKILSSQVYEHIPGEQEQQRFIGELKRVLKQGGLAAISIYNYNLRKRIFKKYSKTGFHDGGIYFENFKHGEIHKLFRPHFKIEKLSGINCYFPFILRFGIGTQKAVESILSRTSLSNLLGEILFMVVQAPSDKKAQARGSFKKHPADTRAN